MDFIDGCIISDISGFLTRQQREGKKRIISLWQSDSCDIVKAESKTE